MQGKPHELGKKLLRCYYAHQESHLISWFRGEKPAPNLVNCDTAKSASISLLSLLSCFSVYLYSRDLVVLIS